GGMKMTQTSEELIIGKNPVIEALKSGRSINKVLVSEQLNKNVLHTLQVAGKTANATIQKVPKKKLDQLSGGNHQGIIAYVAAYEYATIDDLFQNAEEKDEPPFFIVLDELEDRSEEHTSELQSRFDIVCRLLLEKKKNTISIDAS